MTFENDFCGFLIGFEFKMASVVIPDFDACIHSISFLRDNMLLAKAGMFEKMAQIREMLAERASKDVAPVESEEPLPPLPEIPAPPPPPAEVVLESLEAASPPIPETPPPEASGVVVPSSSIPRCPPRVMTLDAEVDEVEGEDSDESSSEDESFGDDDDLGFNAAEMLAGIQGMASMLDGDSDESDSDESDEADEPVKPKGFTIPEELVELCDESFFDNLLIAVDGLSPTIKLILTSYLVRLKLLRQHMLRDLAIGIITFILNHEE